MEVVVGLIVIFLLNAFLAFFYFKWKEERHHHTELQRRYELIELIMSASVGGYYYWQKSDQSEYFSPNLISMFHIRSDVAHFDEFLALLSEDRGILKEAVMHLRQEEQGQIRLNIKTSIAGETHYFQCSGYRIQDDKGEMVGIIVWFFDVTDYIQRVGRITEENHQIKKQMRNYVNILNELPLLVWERNVRNHEIAYCNAAYSKFVDKKDMHGNEQRTPDLYQGLRELASEAYQRRGSLKLRKHLVSNGERRLVEISERPINNDQVILGSARDITELEEVEKELERHVSAHANLLESSSSAIAIYGRDTKLKFYNQAFVRLGMFDQLWLDSNPTYTEVLEYLREKRLLPEQADFKSFRKEQLQLFENLIEMREDLFYLPNGRTLRVVAIPHALGGVLFSYEDVTDRLAMERSYNTLIAVQKVTLDHVREGIMVLGEDGVIKLYNPQFVALWPDTKKLLDKKPHLSDLLEESKALHLFKTDEEWKHYKEGLLADLALRSPMIRHIERADGKVIDRISVPLPSGDTLISFVDVTDSSLLEKSLRERNEALEQADRLKTEFLANVSYELRTPLTSILGFSELLMLPGRDPLTLAQKEYIQGIHDSSELLKGLINDVLDLASIEAGFMELERSTIDMGKVVKGVVNLFGGKIEQKQIKLAYHFPKKSVTIHADEHRIKQVVFNLINHAVKRTPIGKVIDISIKQQEQGSGKKQVELSIKDSGKDITVDDQERVFERFYVPEGQDGNEFGSGLGLAVVKNIVELHGGFVSIHSSKGSGMTITCVFELD